MLSLRVNRELTSGILLLGAGAAFILLGKDLRFGTLRAMGPGFLPIVTAAIACLLALAVIVRSQVGGEGSEKIHVKLRPLVLVCAVPLVFGATIEPLGLVGSVIIAFVIVRASVKEQFDVGSYIVAPCIMAAFCGVLFVKVLGQSISLWPQGVSSWNF